MCTRDGCHTQTDTDAGTRPVAAPDAVQRRAFLAGLAGLPLAMVLADPALAQAAAARLTPVSLPAADGSTATGMLTLPQGGGPAPAVLLIHEWWGLNDQIKAVAAEFAAQGYVALAVDLFGGQVATTREQAQQLTGAVDGDAATAQLVALIAHLRGHEAGNGKVGTVGWCFGGAWSLSASTAAPVDATVIYYGRVNLPAQRLRGLAGPVLGHFATQDQGIDRAMVEGFQAAMAEAGKADQLTMHWYEADHAFANPTGARYDADDAALAWQRTMDFYQTHLSA